MIREYLKDNILIFDGAMGTYYADISKDDISHCELCNLTNDKLIKRIHRDYIDAGASIIRTNTFAANTKALELPKEKIKEIITAGVNIAKDVTKDNNVYVAADIGPIREENLENEDKMILEEYKYIVDCFLEQGINIFVFETFSNTNYLKEVSQYIKNKDKEAFILVQFAIKPDGYSRDGISIGKIFETIYEIENIDAYGLNCGSGPNSMLNNLKKIEIKGKIISALPNSGYPMVVNERTVYTNNPEYFKEIMKDIKALGVKIIGGCCGTKPSYIKSISEINYVKVIKSKVKSTDDLAEEENKSKVKNTFKEKLQNNKFVTVIELSAPMDTNIDEIMKGAKLCKENNIDLVTVPDSPMSRVRADSVLMASKVKREIGIEAMPHLCCRDKNTNAIRSSLLGANIENIRNILAITGDPISDADKVETKKVFNLNSFKLMKLISDTNDEIFKGEEMYIGGALNLNVLNKESEYKRMLKKMENGASFFLTQPIYDDKTIDFLKEIKKRSDAKIIAGILPIVTLRNALFLNNELPGVNIPKDIIDRFSSDMTKEEAQEVGVQTSVEIASKLKDACDGFYFITPFKRVSMLIEIIKRLGL